MFGLRRLPRGCLRGWDSVSELPGWQELLGWRERLDRGAFRLALHEACAAWPEPESRVRFDVLAAPAERLGTAARSLLLVYPFEPVPAEYMARGVGLEVTRELEREDPLIKRAEFVQRRLPFLTGTRERFDSLMVDAGGHVLEGSTSNFFAVLESVLCTPEDGVLEGVTRRVVLELAEARGLRIRLGTLELGRCAGSWDLRLGLGIGPAPNRQDLHSLLSPSPPRQLAC